MQDSDIKRLCVNIEQITFAELTQMVEKYKLPISDIVNEILKTSHNHEDFMRQLEFHLRIIKILNGNGNQSTILKTNKEMRDNEKGNQ